MKRKSRTRIAIVLGLPMYTAVGLFTACHDPASPGGQDQSDGMVEVAAEPMSQQIGDVWLLGPVPEPDIDDTFFRASTFSLSDIGDLVATASPLSDSACDLCRIDAGCYPCRGETDSGWSFDVGYEAREDRGDIYLSLQLNGQEVEVTEPWEFLSRAMEEGQFFQADLATANFVSFPFLIGVHHSDPDVEILGVFLPGASGTIGSSYSCFVVENGTFVSIGHTEYEPCSLSTIGGY